MRPRALSVRRDAAPEILRCALMFGICLLHANGFSGASVKGLSQILMPCVPAFVFISGFYGIRFSLSKVLRLWCTAAFCCCWVAAILFVMSEGSVAYGHSFCVQLTQNWFLNEYTMLMFVAPTLNCVTSGTDVKKMMLVVVPFLAATFCWNYFAGCFKAYGMPHLREFGGYTFFMMTVVYMLARLYRRFEVWRYITLRIGVVLFLLASLGCLGGLSQYHSPFAVLMAVVAFTFFYKVKWSSFVDKLALLCAPSMFSIFILHSLLMLPVLMPKLYAIVHAKFSAPLVLELLIVTGVVYFGGFFIDLVFRRFALMFVKKPLSAILSACDDAYDRIVNWLAIRLEALDAAC